MFAGVANMLINGTLSPNNPNSGYIASIGGVGAMQPREQSYITRPAAKLAHIGGSYGLTQATWCGYLAAQFDNAWTPDLVNPPGDSTAAYFPINSFSYSNGTWLYPSAGSPPGSTSYGTAPWRDEGLPAIAFAGAYSAFVACGGGYSSYATTAANYVNLLATFLWNYGTSGDGGSMYDINNTSDGLSPLITWNTEVISGGHTQQTGTIAVVAGTNTVNGTNTNFTRNFWPGAKISIQGTTYTVATTPSNTTLTLTVNFTGSNNATEIVFGNTCTIDVTNGMTSVVGHTGTGCDFTVMFGGTNPYIGILTNGGMNPLDARVYKITVNSAASGTLNTAFVGTTGTTAYFVYAPPSPTSCGTSLASACFYGQPGGRNLSQDVCYAYAWEYAYTASATWKTRAQFCYDKQYGGSSAGGVWGGGPNGYSTYYRPGVITATNGSTAVVGYAGLNGDATAFLTQFPHPGTDKVMIADGLTVDGNGVGNGQWNNPSAYLSYLYSTWYLYTVTAVADDYHLTLSAPFAGTTSTKSAIFYNPADAQWTGGGADGGYGVLESILPRCQNAYTSTQYNYPPCGGFDFTVHSGKSPGMGSGAGNAAMGVAIAALTYVTIPGNIFQFVSKGLSWK